MSAHFGEGISPALEYRVVYIVSKAIKLNGYVERASDSQRQQPIQALSASTGRLLKAEVISQEPA